MSGNESSDPMRKKNVAAMGQELGELFTALSIELTFMCWRWDEYLELFGAAGPRIDLLNGSAPFFFWVVQNILFRETLLGIARLTAPLRSNGRPNLTVRRIPALLQDATVRDSVSQQCSAVVGRATFAYNWRNKVIAHHDLDLALGRAAVALPSPERDEMSAVLDDLASLLNTVDRHFLNSTTLYRAGPVGARGARDLLYVIRNGLRRNEARVKKLECGEYDPEEWNDDLSPL